MAQWDKKSSILTTARLCLRSITDDDEGAVVEILTDLEVGKTYMVPEFASRADAVKIFRTLRDLSASCERFVYGISLEDTLIGFLNDVDRDEEGWELGYAIHPRHKNRGYASEALEAAIRELFRMGCTTVRAGAFEENRASMRVMEKCGMTLTGTEDEIPYRGKVHRCVNYIIRQN